MPTPTASDRRLPWTAALSAAALLCFGLTLPACGGSQTPASTSAQAAQSVQTQLTAGPWRLVDYAATLPLDAMTQTLLQAQIRTMVITFDGRTLHAKSPTVDLARPYALENAEGPLFDLVSADVQGAGTLRSHCELRADGRRITFQSATAPWNGAGALERE